jgi:hypothetical protein
MSRNFRAAHSKRHNRLLEQTATSSLRESDLLRGHEQTSSALKIIENTSDRPKMSQNAFKTLKIHQNAQKSRKSVLPAFPNEFE